MLYNECRCGSACQIIHCCFISQCIKFGNHTAWSTDESCFDSRQELEISLFFLKCPHLVWGPHSLLITGYRGLFPRGKTSGAGLFTDFRLLPLLGMSGAVTPLPHLPSWRAQGYFYLHCSVALFYYPSQVAMCFHGLVVSVNCH